MSEFKGTPGPWVVRESSLSLSVSVVGLNGEAVFHESDKRIPGVMDDARLISAAPELLEALEGIMRVEARDRVMPVGAEWDAARAAIAKALGNQ